MRGGFGDTKLSMVVFLPSAGGFSGNMLLIMLFDYLVRRGCYPYMFIEGVRPMLNSGTSFAFPSRDGLNSGLSRICMSLAKCGR